jgi:putative transcriptional regulator
MRNIIKTVTNVTATPDYTPEAVKSLMKYLRMNEKSFALFMNVTPMTVRFWITGAVKPCGLAKRLMQIYELCPDNLARLAEGGEDN